MNSELESFVLTEAAIKHLTDALDDSEDSSDFFARADAIINNKDNLLPLPVALGQSDPLTLGDDGTNSTIVHEHIGEKDRANAADPRLWTYLALVTYRDYMEQRWPVKDVKKWKERIRDRWLLANASRSKLMRHGIARLWWIACLTWDETGKLPLSSKHDDPYAYTRQALSNEDYVVGIFERKIGAMPTVVRAVLEHLSDEKNKASGLYARSLLKSLRLVHGYRDISLLNDSDLHTLINRAVATS